MKAIEDLQDAGKTFDGGAGKHIWVVQRSVLSGHLLNILHRRNDVQTERVTCVYHSRGSLISSPRFVCGIGAASTFVGPLCGPLFMYPVPSSQGVSIVR